MNSHDNRLTVEIRRQIAESIARNDRPYVEIAEDWLISYGFVRKIAREFGVKRPPGAVTGRLSKWRYIAKQGVYG